MWIVVFTFFSSKDFLICHQTYGKGVHGRLLVSAQQKTMEFSRVTSFATKLLINNFVSTSVA